jgi:hypothetical protein
MTDDLDRMLSGGAKSAKFENPGDTIAGVVTDITVRQATEYGTGAPQTFQNGDPKEQIVVTIKSDGEPEDADDDGHRSIYIKGWGPQRRAFIDAVRKAGVKKPLPGDRFTATLLRMEPSKQGGFPAKVFEYGIVHTDGVDFASMLAERAEPEMAAEVNDARAQARKLIESGALSPAQIASATGLPADEVRAMYAPTDDSIPF